MSASRLIAHIVFRFDYGGLENGVVNLVNGLPEGDFDHVIIALSEATAFQQRLREGVQVHALGKRPGKDFGAYLRLYRLLRGLKPAIVHTRNLGTLDCGLVAFLAGVPRIVHGEHGWDVYDPDGTNRKYRLMRRVLSRFIDAFVTVSEDLCRWLVTAVRIPPAKVRRICNGVDTERFRPARAEERSALSDERSTLPAERSSLPADIFGGDVVVVGSVTRFSAIKDPLNVVEAFVRLRSRPEGARLRLVMIGDGELHGRALATLQEAGAADAAWLPGSRDDIAELLRCMDIFVLGSLREGISNTILEAMASGLPVVTTATGGNIELVADGETGKLVPPGDRGALVEAIAAYVADAEFRGRHGRKARERAVSEFSISAMVEGYRRLYAML